MARRKGSGVAGGEALELEARIAYEIGRVGPKNVSLLSRLTGAPVETVRYKIKNQFSRLGFRIQAEVDHRKIGLTANWASLRFSREHLGSAPQILSTLSEVGYLTYHGTVIPQGNHLALFLLPRGTSGAFDGFLDYLRQLGVLTGYTLEEAVLNRHTSMNARYFNFDSGRWDVDWSKVGLETPELPAVEAPSEPVSFDRFDLLLIRELQVDAFQHIVEAAKKLGVHPKTLEYHYRTHIQRHGLISNYVIRWMRNEGGSSHEAVLTRVMLRGLSDTDLPAARLVTARIPFLWGETCLAGGSYVAWLWMPIHEAVTTFGYLNRQLAGLSERVEVSCIGPQDSAQFPIPCHMYRDGGWAFDVEELKSRFLNTARVR